MRKTACFVSSISTNTHQIQTPAVTVMAPIGSLPMVTHSGKPRQVAVKARERSPSYVFDANVPPSASHMQDTALLVIGELAQNRPWHALVRDQVIPHILARMQIDAANLPKGWSMSDQPKNKPIDPSCAITGSMGLSRRVGQAVFRQTTVTSQGRNDSPLAIPERGMWCLTDHGPVAIAAILAGVWPPPVLPKAPVVLTSWTFANTDDPNDGDMVVELLEGDEEDDGYDYDGNADMFVSPVTGPNLTSAPSNVLETIKASNTDDQEAPGPKLEVPPEANLTALWLKEHRAGDRKSSLNKAVLGALGKKLRVSAAASLLEDHAQAFFTKLIRRDSLAKRIQAGVKMSDSLLSSWAVNSARSDIRSGGTEPVAREMLGAKTERELDPKREPPLVKSDPNALGVVRAPDEIGRVNLAHVIAPKDDYTQESLDEARAFWALVENAINTRKPARGALYVGIVKMRAQGCTVKEITAQHGLAINSFGPVMRTVKQVIQELVYDGELDENQVMQVWRWNQADKEYDGKTVLKAPVSNRVPWVWKSQTR